MSPSSAARPAADRNLLFGILALQMDFIDRDALVRALHAWVLEKAKPLGQILVEQGALTGDRRSLLEALVQEHLRQHGDDPAQSLAAVPAVHPVQKALEQIADPDLQASLLTVTVAGRAAVDPHATTGTADIPAADQAQTDPYATRSAPPDMALAGLALRYRILRPHAKGGLGEVFVARDQELQREVALKEIQGRYADDADSRARFLMEAEITGRLEHPGIVPVYGLGTYLDGRPFYAMRFIQGESLKEAIQRFHQDEAQRGERGLPFLQLLARFLSVCNAVAYAHSRGILHRDLKPANVMLGRFGETLVVDWGLAKALRGAAEKTAASGEEPIQPSSGETSEPTVLGRAIGTPQFMSPEQAAGQVDRLGPATDVYSLGATLYHLLTGQAPFTGADTGSVLQQVQAGDFAPPRRLAPATPPALEAICLKAMALKPEDRYASALELAADLEHWFADDPVAAYPDTLLTRAARWTRRHRTFAVGCAALLVTAVLTLAVGLVAVKREERQTDLQRQRAEEAREEAQQALAESQRRQLRLTLTQGAHFLDEGKLLQAFPWFVEALRLDDRHQAPEPIHRFRLAAVLRQCPRLTGVWFHANPVNHAEFSPDGRWVVSAGADDVAQLWDTTRQVARPLAHRGSVLHAAFSPDSRTLVTACADGTTQLWRTETGEPVGPRWQHGGPVHHAAFSPDGRRVLTASQDGTARVWEVETGRQLGLVRHAGPVTGAWFSPDGQSFLTASADHTARVWDTATFQPQAAPLEHAGPVQHAAFSPDGRRVATASQDRTARVWERATGRPMTAPMMHQQGVLWVAFSPDGGVIATAGRDRLARVWDAGTGQMLHSAIRHDGPIYQVVFGPDGRRLATASDDNTARVWDWTTGEPVTPPLPHNGGVQYVAFAGDGWRLVTAGIDGTVRVWDTTRSESYGLPLPAGSPVLDVTFRPDSRSVAMAETDGTVRFWDFGSGTLRGSPLPHPAVALLAFSPDGHWLATASRDGTVRLWNAARLPQSEESRPLELHHGADLFQIAFSPDSRRLLTVGADNRVRLWDPATGAESGPPLVHEARVNYAAFSADGGRVVTAGDDGTARLWDAVQGKALGTPLRHGDKVYVAQFSPDGRRVLTASADHTAQVWDAATGVRLPGTPRHGSKVLWAAFSPDGRRVVTASDDNTARVWDAATGQPTTPPMVHRTSVLRASFSPDGERILTVLDGQAVYLWEAATGEPLTPALRHLGKVIQAVFSPDNRFLVSLATVNARLWQIAGDDRPAEDLERLGQLLGGARIDAAGALVPLKPEETQAVWAALREKYPQEQGASPAEMVRWHRSETQECSALGYAFGVAWHRARLAEMGVQP